MSTGDSGHDKRRHERTPVRLIVEYDGAEDFVGDYTENLSNGGTFIHTSRALERETTIQLVLSFPGLLEPIAIEGIVRWSRAGSQPGVGVEFILGQNTDRLAELVERIRRGDPRTLARVVRVLVAEDNPHVCELICSGLGASAKRSFTDVAFTFATAENGAVALELLQTAPFDVVIVDMYLPVLDGSQVIERARGRLGLVDLPFIAVAAGGESARRSSIAAGANVFLEKPMRLRQLVELMRELVKPSA
jgi:uncharacterized protein (TIGR02266 family)